MYDICRTFLPVIKLLLTTYIWVCNYDAAKYASVSLEGPSLEQVSGWLVRQLLMYAGGSNEQGQPI
ncbi:hypothetical protein NFI96_018940, partial [Prochilodus magdalenae]